MDAVEIAKYTETNMPRTSSTKRKLWKLVTRPTDRGAVENIGLRRFHRRIKSFFTRHPKDESSEPQVASPQSRWLKPLKRVWNRKTNKATYVRLSSVTTSSTGLNQSVRSQRLQTRQKSPPVLGTNVLRKQPTTRTSPRDTLVESTNASPDTNYESRTRFNGPSSRTLPTGPATSRDYHALHKARSVPVYPASKRKDSLDAQGPIDPPTAANPDSASPSARSSTSDVNGPPPCTDDFHLTNSATSSERAEYARLMKFCFKASARRTPIPGFWRLTTPRTYGSGGPTSPHRKAYFAVEKQYRRRVVRAYPTLPMRQRYAPHATASKASRTLPCNWTVRDSEAETATSSSIATSETVVVEGDPQGLDAEDERRAQDDEEAGEEELSERLSRMSCDDDDGTLRHTDADDSDGDTSNEDVWYDVLENPSFGETLNRF